MATKKSSEQKRRTTRTIQGSTRTQQHMAAETDINNIVRRYLPTGALPSHGRPPIYGDFSSIDYQAMQNAIADIDSHFGSLPARIRGRFKGDPYQLMRFLENPQNEKEAIRLGLLLDPSKAFFGHDSDTGMAEDQTDLMSQAEISEAIDPTSGKFDARVMEDLQASAAAGDQEARLLLDAQRAKVAARKAVKAKKTPPEGEEGGA